MQHQEGADRQTKQTKQAMKRVAKMKDKTRAVTFDVQKGVAVNTAYISSKVR